MQERGSMKEKDNALLKKKWIWSALAFGIPFVASIVILDVNVDDN